MKKITIFAALALVLVSALFLAVGPGADAATSSTTTTDGIAVGSVTATGSAINVSLGWTPRYVFVSNPATTYPTTMEWYTGMAAASGLRSTATDTAGDGTAGVPIVSRVTVSGISTYSGSSTAAKGFTIGADTSLNINTNTLYYRAIR